MKKNETLKKHHFWILFGLVPLFVLIAVLVITSSVGARINDQNAAIKTSEDSIKGKTPLPEKLIGVIDVRTEEVKKKKTSLWERNWELQKHLFVWPQSPQLKAIEKMDLPFGAKIPEGDSFAFGEFKKPEVYLAEYYYVDPSTRSPKPQGMVLSVAPTEFSGGWQKVLRHVSTWGQANPTSNQIWLMLEDIWIQRSLLQAIRSVNEQMAQFHRVKFVRDGITIDDPDSKATLKDPLRRRFESRTWAVELEVKSNENKPVLTGRLINLTDRLQLMGLNNTMILNVWFDKSKEARPFEFRIGGEFLPGNGAVKADGSPANVLDIVPTAEHMIPPTYGNVTEIVRVEQKFDTRTVPIRRIEDLALGFTDARYAGAKLLLPQYLQKLEAAATTTSDTSTTGSDSGLSGSGLGPPPMPGAGGLPPRPGLGGTGIGGTGGDPTAGAAGGAGGPLESIIDANKKRYIDVKNAVRRMPVGIRVIVDQSLMQDVLLAFANTPLRFQVTQVTWKRFRGTLGDSTGDGSSGSAGEGSVVGSLSGNFSTDLRPPGGGKFGTGGGFGPPIGPGPSPGGSGFGPPRPGLGGSGMGGPTNPYSPFSPMGGLSTVSESQLTAGLVELSIYGVVSLYEKYSSEQEAAAEAKEKEAKDKEPKGKDEKASTPMDGEPKKGPTDPASKDPMAPESKKSKTRRRTRIAG